ncbi:ferredoxin reductase family protein [Ruicaihuangia caeni]|uniref:Ferric reductase-like transmembrane domain-containing protein n=1 Tax=Ruicaihuangia caeni TaxID=3042517 RepID=A0AAW6TBR9_9MICO|nr:ferric reductase-like transmembrane domain-containing protein [Klugiella sp. YN-L-19]MDI2098805.1 ferric reductase-like transmembrane domain-containing protein [Klugiella sp. YN-L-19]
MTAIIKQEAGSSLLPGGSSSESLRERRSRRLRRRRLISDLLVTTLWASAAAAAALYLASGGMADWGTAGGVVTGLGILTGLIGSDFVLVMLVLVARIPALDAAIGHDRAIALHRRLGKPALYLLLAHAVLLLLGYAMTAGIDIGAQWAQLWAMPDMPLAFIAVGLLVLVVVTSLVVVRRKLPYEFWYGVHLLTYVAVLTALPHQLSVGGVLAEGTVQRAYWIALYIVAIGAIVAFRIIEPAVQSLRHQLRVERVEWIAPDVASLYLRGRQLRELGARGGQYFFWRFWTCSTWWHAHPISLSAAPTDDQVRITVRVLGHGTRRITSVPSGTRVSFSGPFGLFTDAARTAPRLAIVAAGIGVTPVRALLETGDIAPGEATVLLRSSSADSVFLRDEMRALTARRGARLFLSLGRRGGHDDWLAGADRARGASLRSVFPHLLASDLYICGPERWVGAVAAEARAAGLPDEQIHAERFDW